MADLVLGIAKSLVDGTLSKAQSAIQEEAKLRASTQRDLVFIAGEFHMMQSFLGIISEEHVEDGVVSTWVTQVRDLAYDVEDCIEFVLHLDKKPDWWRRFVSCSFCNCAAKALPLDEAVANIEQLKARVEDVSRRNARYNQTIGDPGSSSVMQKLQPLEHTGVSSSSFDLLAEESKQRDVLTRLLTTEGSTDLQVISVWATGAGNGAPATVVKKVYDDPRIWSSFTCRAYVKLKHPFNLHEFIRSLLDQFHANSSEEQGSVWWTRRVWNLFPTFFKRKSSEEQEGAIPDGDVLKRMNVQEFKKQVNNQKFLVVLQDLSSMTEWDAIRKYLPDSSRGSRVLLSTQEFEVANFCTGTPYKQWFSADQSLCVFFKEVIGLVNQTPTEDPQTDAHNSPASLACADFVGRKSEMDELLGYLNKALFDDLHVLSVWGIAGSGKSALVRTFYRETLQIHPRFYKHSWVDVSHPFNLRELCQTLLLDLHSSHSLEANKTIHCDNMGIRDPVKECRRFFEDHKCVIVIDDLQSKEEWDLIEAALVSRYTKSIIVVITNDVGIASHCADRKELVFNVKGLELEAAIHLFKKEVRRWQQDFEINYIDNDIALNQIISKCGGLPKVIVAAAEFLFKILHDRKGRVEMMNTEFMHNLETRPEFTHLRGMFGWTHSYFRTCPDLLRPCIFYLSIFPNSQAIRRRRLVMRWVAEGYSKDNGNSTAEKNGEELFAKLIQLSMIQPLERTIITHQRMVMCQVSAFFHEYIISRPNQENITFALEVITLDGSCRQITGRTGRHLVIEENWERDRNVFESIDFTRLRSLTVFGKWESFLISGNMKVLRVLDLENASDVTDKDLEKVVKLLNRLKFLSLRGCCKISHLPKSLDRLRQLQTLDVRHTTIVTLQPSVIKLKKLQYIRAGSIAIPCTLVSLLPELCRSRQIVGVAATPGIGKLTLLHTLGVVNISGDRGEAILKEFRNLTQLRKLGVSGVNKKNREEVFSAISSLIQLESLSVWLGKDNEGCLEDTSFSPPNNLQSLKLYGLEGKLPEWIAQLSHLRKMHLETTQLSEEYLQPLRYLEELSILRLSFKEPLGGNNLVFSVRSDGQEVLCYKEVKVLEISCSSSVDVTFGTRAMQNLEVLKITCSANLDVTFGQQAMPNLKLLQLKGPHDENALQELRRRLAELPKRPVLKAFLNMCRLGQNSSVSSDKR